MIIYPSIFGLSLIGILMLTRRYYIEAKVLPSAELRLRLKAGVSIRSRIWSNFLYPTFLQIKSASLPAFLRSSEYAVKWATRYVAKIEDKLKHLADTIHGKAINLDVSQKSEYWNDLNSVKGNGQPEPEVGETPKVIKSRPKRIILK